MGGKRLYPYEVEVLEQVEQKKKMRKALKQSEEPTNNKESKLKTEEEKKKVPESKPKTKELLKNVTLLPNNVLCFDLTNDEEDEKNANEKPGSKESPKLKTKEADKL